MGILDTAKSIAGGGVGLVTGKTQAGWLGLDDEYNSGLSLLPGIGDSMAAQEQNAANIAAANRAMQFSERMSSTAYQRGMKDMKAAGLNPMLAFMQGGASAPSGTTPTINSTTKSGFGTAAISAGLGLASAATARQQADTQQAVGESSVQLNKASAAKQVADTAKSVAETKRTQSETRRADSERRRTDTLHELDRKELPRARGREKFETESFKTIDRLINSLSTDAKTSKRQLEKYEWNFNQNRVVPKGQGRDPGLWGTVQNLFK